MSAADPRDLLGPEDPMEMVGVGMPATRADLEEMARCLIEEYAMLGYSSQRILQFFQTPFYAGAYHLTEVLGMDEIERIAGGIFAGEA